MAVIYTSTPIGVMVEKSMVWWSPVVSHLDHPDHWRLVSVLVLVGEWIHEMAEWPRIASVAACQGACVTTIVLLLLLLEEHVLTEVGGTGVIAVGAITGVLRTTVL